MTRVPLSAQVEDLKAKVVSVDGKVDALTAAVGKTQEGVNNLHKVLHLNGETPYVTSLIEQATVILEQTQVIAEALPYLKSLSERERERQQEEEVDRRRQKRRHDRRKKWGPVVAIVSTVATLVIASVVSAAITTGSFPPFVPHADHANHVPHVTTGHS